MKLLLDTHIWLWGLAEPKRLSRQVYRELTDTKNELWISPVSTWEILLLHADTVFTSLREKIPEGAVSGNVYNISALVRGSSGRPLWGEAA